MLDYKIIDVHDIDKSQYHGFIYVTINKVNGMKYVGQHTKWNDKYLGSGRYLRRAIDKYGRENFERIIIDVAKTQQELNEKEEYYINEVFNSVKSPKWYNIKDGSQQTGNCFAGLSKEDYERAVKNQSESYRRRIENGGQYPATGMKHSDESKEKIGNAQKGKKKPEGMGRKLAESIKGENHWSVKRGQSKESNEKRSETLSGKGNHNVNLLVAYLPTGEVVEGYGMRELHLKLMDYGYDIPPRSINTASKSQSQVYKKYNIRFERGQ